MTKEENEDFGNSTKCWICDNAHANGDAYQIIFISVKYIEVLRIEIVISISN